MPRKQAARSPTREEREEVLRDLNETEREESLKTLKAVEESCYAALQNAAKKPRKTKKAKPPVRSPLRSPSYSPPPPRSVFAKREEYVEAYDMWNRLNPGHRETPDEEK